MSVLIVTSLGDMVIDLHTNRCPLTCKNFLKLCKIKYYNGCLFHNVDKDFIAQTGDPTGTGSGGDSIYKYLYGDQARFFGDEIHLDLKHSKTGTVAMTSAGQNMNASQFYITLRDDLDYLDQKHTVFGEIAEGLETLSRINEAYVDDKGRPYKNIRIKHTYILEDPFDDPPQLAELVPDASPQGKLKDEVNDEVRLEDDWVPLDEQLAPGELEEVIRTKEARSRAVVLESIGDIPDAEIKPPENVLFVCKLNPVSEDEDLHTIFSRFGTVTSADIIRDFKTGDSLCYAFIEFEDTDACNQAYLKMANALIDDRRIQVDFSQSAAKLWSQYRRKDQQNGNTKGCFKCGAPDHIAKDCTGSPTTKHPTAKYILKDDKIQHGCDSKSRYEMVFDGESGGSPQRNKEHGKLKVQDLNDRRRDQGLSRREGAEFRSKSDSIHRDGKVHEEYKKRSLESDARHERKYSKRIDEGSHRDERESRNRNNNKSNPGDRRDAENNMRGDTGDDREHKRSLEKKYHGGRRDDRNYRKRNAEIADHGNRRDERDYKRRRKDNDV
ncbi:Peptidyl-prolyl cis-trans isomerase [Heracleum sosnowskyi]|uniref:Peptidyl-prolyl cis-trans isomerase n=1 Tax=Heracleum sosnowskyi TaxID=360622 RepID=A0AAD8JIJ7_9APIA|nr:Peptidyl-prolyl cis-trans isomerase [Heracleum sosnowskyi]